MAAINAQTREKAIELLKTAIRNQGVSDFVAVRSYGYQETMRHAREKKPTGFFTTLAMARNGTFSEHVGWEDSFVPVNGYGGFNGQSCIAMITAIVNAETGVVSTVYLDVDVSDDPTDEERVEYLKRFKEHYGF